MDEAFVGVALGRDLCGHDPSEQSELGTRPQKSRPQGHTHKGIVPFWNPRRPILDRWMQKFIEIIETDAWGGV